VVQVLPDTQTVPPDQPDPPHCPYFATVPSDVIVEVAALLLVEETNVADDA